MKGAHRRDGQGAGGARRGVKPLEEALLANGGRRTNGRGEDGNGRHAHACRIRVRAGERRGGARGARRGAGRLRRAPRRAPRSSSTCSSPSRRWCSRRRPSRWRPGRTDRESGALARAGQYHRGVCRTSLSSRSRSSSWRTASPASAPPRIEAATREEVARLEERLRRLQQRVYGSLTAWQRAQIARHPKRPHALDFFRLLLDDFIELHGDRVFGDDMAIVGGPGRLRGRAGGGARPPEGARHAREHRAELRDAAPGGLPQGAAPHAARAPSSASPSSPSSTRRAPSPGSAPRSAARPRRSRATCARWRASRTPVIAVVTGEGGSGGALAIGVANRVLMLEHAIYSVISPEGCAAILWGDAAKAPEAASLMRVTAPDLLRLGVIDGGGARARRRRPPQLGGDRRPTSGGRSASSSPTCARARATRSCRSASTSSAGSASSRRPSSGGPGRMLT